MIMLSLKKKKLNVYLENKNIVKSLVTQLAHSSVTNRNIRVKSLHPQASTISISKK